MLTGKASGDTCEIFQTFNPGNHINDFGFLNGTARVAGFNQCQFIVAITQNLGGLEQHTRTLCGRCRFPDFKSGPCGLYRRINIGGCTFIALGKNSIGRGVQRGHFRARTVGFLAVDEILYLVKAHVKTPAGRILTGRP